jgi:hypothetical protein
MPIECGCLVDMVYLKKDQIRHLAALSEYLHWGSKIGVQGVKY